MWNVFWITKKSHQNDVNYINLKTSGVFIGDFEQVNAGSVDEL